MIFQVQQKAKMRSLVPAVRKVMYFAFAISQTARTLPAQVEPVLVMIHGRDEPVWQRDKVQTEWEGALERGFRAAGVPQIPKSSRRFFWYADIIDHGRRCQFAEPHAELYDTRGGREFWDRVRDLILAAAGQMPNALERALAQKRVSDTETYLSSPLVACAVDQALEQLIASVPAGAPIILVAHSMGSMIAYRNLMGFGLGRMPQASFGNVAQPVYLITIGSMIGNPSIQRALIGSHAAFPGVVPRPVVWWRNVMNKGDLLAFAAAPAFKSVFPKKRPIDVRINTDAKDRHNAVGYLGSPEFAKTLHNAWCAASPNPTVCVAAAAQLIHESGAISADAPEIEFRLVSHD